LSKRIRSDRPAMEPKMTSDGKFVCEADNRTFNSRKTLIALFTGSYDQQKLVIQNKRVLSSHFMLIFKYGEYYVRKIFVPRCIDNFYTAEGLLVHIKLLHPEFMACLRNISLEQHAMPIVTLTNCSFWLFIHNCPFK